LVFLCLYLFFSALTRNQWGTTFDEPNVYLHGIDLGDYLAGRSNLLSAPGVDSANDNIVYCHLYAWVFSLFSPDLHINQAHWFNLVLAVPMFSAAYEILLFTGVSSSVALLGPLFLFFSPRLLGNLPINPKDGPFAVLYLAALALLILSPFRRRLLRCGVWSLVVGLGFCLRPLGVTLPLLFALDAWSRRFFREEEPGGAPRGLWILLETLAISLGGLLFAMVFWPYLRSPSHWPWLLNTWSHYPHNGFQIFWGSLVADSSLPWFYFPGWLALSTPVFLLGLALLGWKWVSPSSRAWRILWAALLLNLFALMLKRPSCYDTVRHFLYLLPMLSVLAALSLAELWKKTSRFRPFLLPVVLIGLSLPAVEMFRLHPYEYLYLSEWSGGFQRSFGKFPGDYWSASAQEGFQWLRYNGLTDPKRIYKIQFQGIPFLEAVYYLPHNAKWADGGEDSNYYMGTRDLDPAPPGSRLIKRVERERVPLLWIYQLR
jgi:hypothetical protein